MNTELERKLDGYLYLNDVYSWSNIYDVYLLEDHLRECLTDSQIDFKLK